MHTVHRVQRRAHRHLSSGPAPPRFGPAPPTVARLVADLKFKRVRGHPVGARGQVQWRVRWVQPVKLLAWTTTPWSLLANEAICVRADIE